MEIIPVLDLMKGQVVHARAGARASYQPLRSRLAPDSRPLSVVAGLMDLAPFRQLYVADLDAIAQAGDHDEDIDRISAGHPDLEIWVDRGLATADDCRAWLRGVPHRLVLGSESQSNSTLAISLEREFGARRLSLSLDFKGNRFLGPAGLLENPRLWPETVIAMTLARVGGQAGPDLDRLGWIANQAPNGRVYGAGGVRGRQDLMALTESGAAGCLVASALHDGRLQAADIEAASP